MIRLAAVGIIVLALVIGIAPRFTDCASQGRSLTLENGMQVPMKCHWTGVAEIGVAVPLGLIGVLALVSKRRESIRNLGVLAIAGGALAILFPTYLIGVCTNPDMICNMVMRPLLVGAGILAMVAGLGMILGSRKLDIAA
jgi:hypothetical protein